MPKVLSGLLDRFGATILTLAVVYFATPYVSKAIYSLTPIDEMVEQQYKKR